jgi:4-amino-4-deoxy-L-arabinose transferase-like glycosyltransferase
MILPAASLRSISRPAFAAIAAAFILALILRVVVGDHSLVFDELASLFFAEQPVSRLWSDWMLRETNPPLFYTLLKGWVALFGHSLGAIRALPTLAGMASMVVLIVIALRAHGERAAVAVAVITALSAQHIFLSDYARGYIFSLGGVALATLGLLLLIRDDHATRRTTSSAVALYVLGSLLAIYTHTTMFIWPLVATLSMVLLYWRRFFQDRDRLLLVLFAANAIILVVSGWWLWITVQQVLVTNDNLGWIKPRPVREMLWMFRTESLLTRSGDWVARIGYLAVTLLAAIGVARNWREPETRLLTLLGVLSFGTLMIVGSAKPVLTQLTIMWPMIFPLLLAGMGVASFRSTGLRLGALTSQAVLLTANTYTARGSFMLPHDGDWRLAFRSLATVPDGAMVVEGESMKLAAEQACRVTFPNLATCPVPILAIRAVNYRADRWARGLAGSMIAWEAVPKTVDRTTKLFAFRNLTYDASERLLGHPSAVSRTSHPLSGPFTAEDFAKAGSPAGPNARERQIMSAAP